MSTELQSMKYMPSQYEEEAVTEPQHEPQHEPQQPATPRVDFVAHANKPQPSKGLHVFVWLIGLMGVYGAFGGLFQLQGLLGLEATLGQVSEMAARHPQFKMAEETIQMQMDNFALFALLATFRTALGFFFVAGALMIAKRMENANVIVALISGLTIVYHCSSSYASWTCMPDLNAIPGMPAEMATTALSIATGAMVFGLFISIGIHGGIIAYMNTNRVKSLFSETA